MVVSWSRSFGVALVALVVVGCESGSLSVVPSDVMLPDAGPPSGRDGGTSSQDFGPDCTPDCTDRTCGADGCGGSCGSCGAGTTCQGGACMSTGPECGNGVLDDGEVCDGDCPTSCPNTACATRTLVGSAADCDARCESTPISTCASGDGCCPSGCSAPADDDCSFDCTDLAAWPADWAAEEDSALEQMNVHRGTGYECASGPRMSVPPYTMNDELRIAARCHSQDMAVENFFSHTGSDGSNFSTRCNRAGYTGGPRYENIAAGNGTGVASVGQWMGSSTGHCDAVMASNANEVGIGYMRLGGTRWTHYWTAVFGNR